MNRILRYGFGGLLVLIVVSGVAMLDASGTLLFMFFLDGIVLAWRCR